MRRPTRFTAVLILASIVVGNLFFLRPATAQDLVATEDLVGGSSVFVFREGRKKPQRHAGVGRVRARRDDARATRVSSQAAASARRRRLAEIARRKQLARSTGRKAAISNSLTAKAEQFLDADKIDLAITNFRAALAEDAKNVRASQGLSVALTAKGIETAGETNNAAAAPLFEEAVRLDPQNDAAFAKLGAIYDAEGRQADAITNYERAIAINPDYALIYPSLGIAYIQQGEIAKGQAALSNAERAGINDADVEFLRGLIAFRNDRDDAAAAAFEKASASEARFVESQYYRGRILSRQGKTADAVASYRGALRREPSFTPAAFDLGVEEYNAGNYDEAAVAYNEAIKYDNGDSQAHANLASTYRQLEQYPAANAEYKIASTDIKNANLYSEWGYCLGKTSEWEKAVVRLNTAVEMEPTAVDSSNVGWAYYNAGQFQLAAKNESAARTNFELARNFSQRAVSQDPKLDAGLLNLGASYNSLGEFQLAVNALTTALDLHKDWVVALNQLGYGYRGLGDLNDAIAAFKRAVDLDGRNSFGLYNLGSAYYAAGDKKNARKINDQLRRVDPKLSAQLDMVIAGKVIDDATRKVKQAIPRPRFPF